MIKTRWASATALASVLFALVVPAPGCGTSPSSICSDICDCEGCSESELADCVDDVEDGQKAAEDMGCGDQFDAALACYGDEFRCVSGDIDVDGCNTELDELSGCADGTPIGFGNACDRYAAAAQAKVDECGLDGSGGGGGTVQCTGDVVALAQCLTPCIENVPCAALDGSDQEALQVYSDCVGACA